MVGVSVLGMNLQWGDGLMSMPTYDIFSGTCYKDAKWLEAIEGLAAAQERMKQLSQTPGRYFVFSIDCRAIISSVDTTKPRADQARAAS